MKTPKMLVIGALLAASLAGGALAQDIAPEATPEPVAPPVTEYEGALEIEEGGLRFLLPGWVANGVVVEQVEAIPFTDDVMPQASFPAHTRLDFIDYLPDDSPEITRNFYATPGIYVFNTADFAEWQEDEYGYGYVNELQKLTGILDGTIERLPETSLPYLPLVGGGQVFYAHDQLVSFEGGKGIVYLAAYAYDVSPVMEGQVQFVFQGITDDGQTYISVILPVDTSILPEELGEDYDWAAFDANYLDYIAELPAEIDAIPDDAFVPHFDAMLALVGSLEVVAE